MTAIRFLKKHKDDVIRIASLLVISALMAVFIQAFRADKLPHSSDGDAFDTIYAPEQIQ